MNVPWLRSRIAVMGITLTFVLMLLSPLKAEAGMEELDPNYYSFPATIGRSIGNILRDAVRTAGEMRKAVAEADQDIKQARERFWLTYPDKPGFAEADSEFARQLGSEYALHGRDDRPRT